MKRFERQPISHVWFDLEGTLVKKTARYRRVYDELAVSVMAELLEVESGEAAIELENRKSTFGSISMIMQAITGAGNYWTDKLGEIDVREFIKPDDHTDTAECLEELDEREILYSVFGNTTRDRTRLMLESAGIDSGRFEHMLAGDNIPERKPHPSGFLQAIELSGGEPEALMFVGDREAVDIVPANSVGMATVMIGTSQAAQHQTPTIAAVPEIVDFINATRTQ